MKLGNAFRPSDAVATVDQHCIVSLRRKEPRKLSQVKKGYRVGKVSDKLIIYIPVVQAFQLETVMSRLESTYSHYPSVPLVRKTFPIDLFYLLTITLWNIVKRE